MAIHLIIDGYNLIRQSPWLGPLDAEDLEAGREALISCLADYRRKRPGHLITLVFDGWQGGSPWESRDLRQGIRVVYSRRGERADEVIKRLLHREKARAVLVSSDRELKTAADQVGAVWVSASEFESRCLHPPMTVGEPEEELEPGRPEKKGPARRLKKSLRRKQLRLRKL
jgi:predicted RNA-binding protein with PIN domain|uniref:NYN domain-containing protein n=1 Tax=Desulfobacca acetoxidans TaxID=60893 RepID=A0A7C5ER84_9BACT